MIVLPMDSFLMGGPPGESRLTRHIRGRPLFRPVTPEAPYIAHFEGPVHEVTIDIPIAMAVNELTFDDWNACLADGGCGDYRPSNEVLVAGGSRKMLGEGLGANAVVLDGSSRGLAPFEHPLGCGSPQRVLAGHQGRRLHGDSQFRATGLSRTNGG